MTLFNIVITAVLYVVCVMAVAYDLMNAYEFDDGPIVEEVTL